MWDRMLTVSDRVEVSTGLKAGWLVRRIAAHIDRARSVVSREIRHNAPKALGYRLVTADCQGAGGPEPVAVPASDRGPVASGGE